jgi:hypothetical protein
VRHQVSRQVPEHSLAMLRAAVEFTNRTLVPHF